MSDLQLLPLNHPMLKVPPNEFEDWDNADEFRKKLLARQYELGGVGLSANQVGINARVFTMGHEGRDWTFFNPELVSVSQNIVTIEEGCLSAPGLLLKVKRPDKCTLSYQNVDKEIVVEEFEGILARIVLHEYDHMIGQNFLMRVGRLQLDRALTKIKKARRRAKKVRKLVV